MSEEKKTRSETLFKPGKGGNPRGRPKGSKNKATILREALAQDFDKALKKEFSEIMDALVSQAKKGDMKAIKIIMDRVVPVTKAVEINDKSGKSQGIYINIEGMEPKRITGQTIDVEALPDGEAGQARETEET